MIEVNGKYNSAKIFTDNVEQSAISQIIELCCQEFTKDSKIRIMPDVHAGKGCTVGTTMTIQNKVVPNLVGVDGSCGMLCVELCDQSINFAKLDSIIRAMIPSGFNTRNDDKLYSEKEIGLRGLRCFEHINFERAKASIGTLGGGNHFIEVNQNSKGNYYLVIHSGSRNLGKQVAEYYQDVAVKSISNHNFDRNKIISDFMAAGKKNEIESALRNIPIVKVTKGLEYLEGEGFDNYIHDMKIVQRYAYENRLAMARIIVNEMQIVPLMNFTTVHNYIDTKNMILRKGAVSAQKNEKLLIPMNMRDGSLICIGKGNEDWNNSAPHGAGRIMSRSKAKELVDIEEYKDSMKNVFTTSVGYGTIDEAPMAYKPMQEIIDNIGDTVDILEVIKPVYNFKAN